MRTIVPPRYGAASLAVMIEAERATAMNPNKALWQKGDFTRIAECMRESGQALIKELGVTNGFKGIRKRGFNGNIGALPEVSMEI